MKKILSLLLIAMFAISFHGYSGNAAIMKPKTTLLDMVQRLNLSPAQKTQIDQLVTSQKSQYQASFQKLKSINTQIQTLTRQKVLDEPQLDTLINQKKEVIGFVMKQNIITRHQITAILTPEQLEKLRTMMRNAHQMEVN